MMYEEYVKENRIPERTEEQRNIELIMSVMKAKRDLVDANKNFEYAEEELIDYYSYQIKASQAKLDYLVKKAKSRGLALDMINELYFRKNKAQ